MATPGPAQRFPSNIIKISFPQIGGLVFFRVAQHYNGEGTPVAPRAFVEGLPWPDFDMFAVTDGVVDPQGEPHNESVAIVNPVSDKMLTKYRYWAHYAKTGADHNSLVPGFDTYVLDTAQFTEVYNHVATDRIYPVAPRQEALDYFKGPGLIAGQDPELVGVDFLNNTWQEIVVNPPSDEFWAYVAEGAATYHVETSPPIPIAVRDEAAVVIMNLAKLFADMPLVNGRKPAQAKFTIALPTAHTFPAGHGADMRWVVSASAWSPTLSNPVKSYQRRDFPVHDTTTPVSGIAGAFTYDFHVPTFPHPDAVVSVGIVLTVEEKVNATITFGAAGVPPKIELELASRHGGEG